MYTGDHVFAVVRATRTHTEVKRLFVHEGHAESYAAHLNEEFPRGARHTVCQMNVHN